MNCLIYADPHWSVSSSIVRGKGNLYSKRLENIIQSLNWVTEVAIHHDCQTVIFLGDFFDKATLCAEEISALKSIKYSEDISYVFLAGNHEMGRSDHAYTSADAFMVGGDWGGSVYAKPLSYDIGNTTLCFLPYMLNGCDIEETFGKRDVTKKRILFSHNDIKGVRMGAYLSQDGIDYETMCNNFDIIFNGHLHNKHQNDNLINVGNLTGQNFSEDATIYSHGVYILDTDTLEYDFIENPYAFNFYKFDLTDNCSISAAEDCLKKLKGNAVLTVKLSSLSPVFPQIKEMFVQGNKGEGYEIIESRIVLSHGKATEVEQSVPVKDISIDHIAEFRKFVLATLGDSALVVDELDRIGR